MDKDTKRFLLVMKIMQVICVAGFIAGLILLYAVLKGYVDIVYIITSGVLIFDTILLFICATVVDIGIKRKVKENVRGNDIAPQGF